VPTGIIKGMTNCRIGPHRTASNYIGSCLQAKPKNAGVTFGANKPPGTQLAHYKLGRQKSSIRPRSSVAYMSPTVSAWFTTGIQAVRGRCRRLWAV